MLCYAMLPWSLQGVKKEKKKKKKGKGNRVVYSTVCNTEKKKEKEKIYIETRTHRNSYNHLHDPKL